MKSRQEIKAMAKEAMGQQREASILLVLVILGMALALSLLGLIPFLGPLLSIAGACFVVVWSVNTYGAFIKIYKREKTGVGEVASNLQVNFLRKLGGTWWMVLWFVLWYLLFIIPGIVKLMAYFFTPNILADCPDVKATDAIKISMRITKGHKGKIFVFLLSWIGWFILSSLTAGILYVVYVGPYFYAADAGLYLEMRDEAIREGRVSKAELGLGT